MTEDPSHMAITQNEGVQIVEFADRKILDEMAITQIGDQLADIVSAAMDVKLLLSFRQVEHLSSAALGMLIKVHNQIKEKRGALKLAEINPQILEVFKITRLNRLFEIHDTTDKALASF